MNIDVITQYILSIVPAVTAVAGMITTVGIAIAKIKKANAETKEEVKNLSETDRDLKKQLREMHKENAELKHQLNEVMARMKHMYFVEKTETEE